MEDMSRMTELPNDDQPSESLQDKPKHSTREILMEKSGLSSGQIAKAQSIYNNAREEVKEELRNGNTTIGAAYRELKKEKTADEIDILESAAKGLDRWVSNYNSNECLFEFVPEINLLIEKIRDKKITYTE
jgi:hypothetical protein